MFTFVIQNQPNRSGTDLGRKPVRRLAHNGSTFSGVGASGKLGAVQAEREQAALYRPSTTTPRSEATASLTTSPQCIQTGSELKRTLRTAAIPAIVFVLLAIYAHAEFGLL